MLYNKDYQILYFVYISISKFSKKNCLFIKANISPTLSSFKKHLKEFFSKTPNDLYHFVTSTYNIIHRQLRNCSSNLYKDLFDHYLSDSPSYRNCNCKTEDSYYYSFKCPAYNNIRDVLFENIFDLHIDEPITLDLLMFGNSYLDNMTCIWYCIYTVFFICRDLCRERAYKDFSLLHNPIHVI